MLVRTKRTVRPSDGSAKVKAGGKRCATARQNAPGSPASSVSTVYRPVTVRGARSIMPSRPVGDGSQPNR